MATASKRSTSMPVELAPGEDLTGLAAPDTIPQPTAIKAAWYPCTVQVPGHPPRSKAKAYVTPEGLFVYWAVPDPPESWAPDYWAPITWPQPKPPPPHMTRNGFRIVTDYGLVTITTDGGCGCGWPLKRWTPRFADANVAW